MNQIIRILSSLMILLILSSGVLAFTPSAPAPFAEGDMPPYVIVLPDNEDTNIDPLPDSVYNRLAGKVVFKVNSTQLNPNDTLLRRLADEVLPHANESEWMLIGIDMRGAASPEGTYSQNVKLADGRVRALTSYISERLDSVQLIDMQTSALAEDYGYLLYLLDQAADPAAPQLRAIIDKYTLDNPKAIKEALRRADGGKLWNRLLQDYYPSVRTARILLIFKRIYPLSYEMHAAPPTRVERARIDPVAPAQPILLWMPTHPIGPEPQPHRLSLGTNVLYDLFYMPRYGWAPMPNLALEYYPRHGNFTFGLAFLFPYYHRYGHHKFFQIRDYHLEARRYFNPGLHHTGWYLGAYLNANKYGIGLSDTKGWQGEGWGGALKVGYVLGLGTRWRMDMHLAFGGYTTRYDPYVYGNPITGADDGDYYYDWTGNASDFHRRNHRFSWIGPTEVGITFTYDILHYPTRK